MHNFRRVSAASNAALFMLLSAVASGLALQLKTVQAQPCAGIGGWVVSVEGDMTISGLPTAMGAEFCLGEEIIIGQKSRAAIRLAETQTVVRVNQSSTFVVDQSDDGGILLKLLKGVLYLFSRSPQNLSVDTPYFNAAIDGTEFVIESFADRSDVTVIEGSVLVSNTLGTVRINPGEAANADVNGVPLRRTVVHPLDAAQWALYYPSIGANENTSTTIRKAAESLARGDVESAELTLSTSIADAASLALQSIIAVTRNQSDKAIQLARRAVKDDSGSSLAYSALSYAQQAKFDIDQALGSAIVAVKNDVNNADALARLAELQLGVDQTTDALASAHKAVRVEPENSRARTVLGFVNLVRLDISEAIAAFSEAIASDPGDPLPRMGLGLAVIRDGRLVEGREHIEVAASLDPANALIRSYLGKAYFEERQTADASAQFTLAQQFDPQDPTPWFYDAILLQSLNQPIDAYKNMSKAISLNNNLLVYQSRVLVDKSAAASTLGLAKIYDDLGFQQLAVNEGTKAIALDSNSFFSYRFLADSYAQRERHETARENLLFQSAQLQPMTINSVQPKSLAADLLLLPAAGLSRPSINEYTPLFDQKNIQVSGSFFGGSQQTLGDEIVLAGLADLYTFSLGQFHFETDGFRTNNDIKHDIYNLNLQIQTSPTAFVHAGYTERETDRGDLSLSLDPDQFSRDFRFQRSTKTARLGLRLEHNHNSTLLVSLRHISRTEEALVPGDSTQAFTVEGQQAHMRYNFKKSRIQHAVGLEAYDIISNTNLVFDDCVGESCMLNLGKAKSVFGNIYYYMDASQNQFQWTVGSSVTNLNDDELLLETTKLNPKIGLRWHIADSHELRLAASAGTQKRNSVDRTLEPIVLAGFNQIYDDAAGSRYLNGGIGYDWNTNESTKTGVELLYRDLDIPRLITSSDGSNSLINEPQQEFNVRGYIHKIINSQVTVSAKILYEDFNRTVTKSREGIPYEQFPSAVKTFSNTVSFTLAGRTGLYLKGDASYINQDVYVLNLTEEQPTVIQDIESIHNDFWNFNIGLGYKSKSRLATFQIDINNIFNEAIAYQDQNIQTTNISNPRYSPERSISAQLSFVLP